MTLSLHVPLVAVRSCWAFHSAAASRLGAQQFLRWLLASQRRLVGAGDMESEKAHVGGIVVRDLSCVVSNYRSTKTLDEYCKEQGVVGAEPCLPARPSLDCQYEPTCDLARQFIWRLGCVAGVTCVVLHNVRLRVCSRNSPAVKPGLHLCRVAVS